MQDVPAQNLPVPNASDAIDAPRESHMDRAPRLTPLSLSVLLLVMCTIPLGTIAWLQVKLPPATISSLEARVTEINSLPDSIYDEPLYDRLLPEIGPSLIVENLGSEQWTMVNVRINNWFEFYYDRPVDSVELDGKVEVVLHTCRGKDGTPFSPLRQPVRTVRIFARLPSGKRATFEQKFD